MQFQGEKPIFLQLAEQLEDGILSGAYPEGSQVPQWALEQRIFFSADGSSHGQTGRVLCTQRCGASLSPVRKGAFSDGASWPAVLGPRPD